MRILSALLVGLFSGFLIYMIFGLIIGPREVSSPFVMTTFLGGWALTTYVVLNGAATVAKVWSSGGLIGAVEWLLFGLAMLLYSGKTLAEKPTFGAGLNSMMGIALAVFMAIPCLILYFVTARISSELQPGTARIKCPQCAETIAAEANKCQFCGSMGILILKKRESSSREGAWGVSVQAIQAILNLSSPKFPGCTIRRKRLHYIASRHPSNNIMIMWPIVF